MLESGMATETKAVETEAAPKQYVLNATHRCDACGAAAYYQITMDDGKGTEWLFCYHHHAMHGIKLLDNALFTIDESEKLLVKVSSSA